MRSMLPSLRPWLATPFLVATFLAAACDDGGSDPQDAGAPPGDAAVDTRDSSADAKSDDPSVTSDADAAATADADASMSDADAGATADADAAPTIDADGAIRTDGPCACTVIDGVVTAELSCYCRSGPKRCRTYDDALSSCGGLFPYYNRIDTYADCNLVIISVGDVLDRFDYVYDATTHALVGAAHISDTDPQAPCSWRGGIFPPATCAMSSRVERCRDASVDVDSGDENDASDANDEADTPDASDVTDASDASDAPGAPDTSDANAD